MSSSKKSSLKSLIKIGLVSLVLAKGCSYVSDCTISEGDRVGHINQFSRSGLIFKSYEGTLALEGLSDQGANLWHYSIDRQARNDEDIKQLSEDMQKYLDNQKLVKIHYRKPIKVFTWRADTQYLVQSVEPIEHSNEYRLK